MSAGNAGTAPIASVDVAPNSSGMTPSARAALHPVPSAEVNFRVLLLEDDAASKSILVEAVRSEIPDAEILRTVGALGALAMAALYDFDLLLIGAPVPGDLGRELLEAFHEHNPGAEVVLLDAEQDSYFSAEETGTSPMHTLAAPLRPLDLVEILRKCYRGKHPAREASMAAAKADVFEEEEGHFVVVLSRHTPVEVVQLKCLAGATTALDFIRRNGPGGRIWFERGEIIHAETDTLTGQDALIDMINWPGGSIVEVEIPPPREKTIDMCWQSLLMAAVHAADERKAREAGICEAAAVPSVG
jgi:DNA-binding NarL/FixJ family response regulator